MENKQLSDRELFGMLCDQVLEKHFQEQAPFEVMDCRCRRSHFKKLSKIMGCSVNGHVLFSKKLLIAILAAAIVFLAGCTVFIYRDQIKGLITEFFEEYVLVTTEAAYKKPKIEETYYLGYIPEGFEKAEEKHLSYKVYYKYANSDGDSIIFFQLSDSETRINTEDSNTKDFQIDDRSIFIQYNQDTVVYMWNENGYFMNLCTNDKLSEENIQSIIKNIKPKNN